MVEMSEAVQHLLTAHLFLRNVWEDKSKQRAENSRTMLSTPLLYRGPEQRQQLHPVRVRQLHGHAAQYGGGQAHRYEQLFSAPASLVGNDVSQQAWNSADARNRRAAPVVASTADRIYLERLVVVAVFVFDRYAIAIGARQAARVRQLSISNGRSDECSSLVHIRPRAPLRKLSRMAQASRFAGGAPEVRASAASALSRAAEAANASNQATRLASALHGSTPLLCGLRSIDGELLLLPLYVQLGVQPCERNMGKGLNGGTVLDGDHPGAKPVGHRLLGEPQ